MTVKMTNSNLVLHFTWPYFFTGDLFCLLLFRVGIYRSWCVSIKNNSLFFSLLALYFEMCSLSCGSWYSMLKKSEACAADPCLAQATVCHQAPHSVPAGTECSDWCCPLDVLKLIIVLAVGVVLFFICIVSIFCSCRRKKKNQAKQDTLQSLYLQDN